VIHVTCIFRACTYISFNENTEAQVRKALKSVGFVAVLLLLGGIYALALAGDVTTR
jgi:hypothetical protein